MQVQAFIDHGRTWTLTYLVYDEDTGDAIVIDPILDLDTTPWRTSTASLDRLLAAIHERQLHVHWIFDTHVHADHISGSATLKQRLGAPMAIGANIRRVQAIFKETFNLPASFPTDGSQFDRLLNDGDEIHAGSLKVRVLHTPGHTPACCTYQIGDALFTGDVLFLPDVGVARCDFPDGSARDLYRSVRRLYEFPDETRVFVGHDYPHGRDFFYETSIGASKASNIDLPESIDEDSFVANIEARDAGLPAPRLLFPSLQLNINAGALPKPEDNDIAYLKVPLNYL
ncbi:MBL fold metallo-hydrolase [Thiohalobacter sp. IOR34]|uniref:MBL fold metallo-hydrolase n=1 Tax=Thiohalobacter sp. IOR34 TaxID=3057176 RepID=UPI0025B018C7|nr:MBL fold metallo-hydrolase [Thiohalobacter sp. IOR34]WJW74977.1 MBL fold metallo-hydrolase [Thiohalobacter sp. IOR34]